MLDYRGSKGNSVGSFRIRTLLIFSGQPRLLDESLRSIQALSKKADILFVVDRKDAEKLDVAGTIGHTLIMDKNEQDDPVEKFILNSSEGWKFRQWQKLDFALKQMPDDFWLRYEFVFKFRTDLFLEDICVSELETVPDDVIYANSDLVFGGTTKSFLEFRGFLSESMNTMTEIRAGWNLNWSTVTKSDMLAARFEWIPIPVRFAQKHLKIMCLFYLQKRLRQKRVRLHRLIVRLFLDEMFSRHLWNDLYGYDLAQRKCLSFRKDWLSVQFQSELAFLFFVVSRDLAIKSGPLRKTWLKRDLVSAGVPA